VSGRLERLRSDLVGIEESHGERADDGDGFREDLARLFRSGLSFVSLFLRRRAVLSAHVGAARVYDVGL